MSLNHDYLLKLFEKSENYDGVASSCWSNLPLELWYQVASTVESKDDLCRLCRTSRTFQSIFQQYLYGSIIVNTRQDETNRRLLWTIQNRHFADLVKHLDVTFDRYGIGGQHCSNRCGRIDSLVGDLVAPLRNLRELTYFCRMCYQHSEIHHSHLKRLETAILTKLELGGECFSGHQRLTLQILSSPCISGITSLELHYETSWDLESPEQALVCDDSFLPCLRELSAQKFKLFTSRLCKGSITSICSLKDRSDLSTALSKSLPGVVSLYGQCMEAIIPSIMDNPTPYLKLRNMSGFVFDSVNDVSNRPFDYVHF